MTTAMIGAVGDSKSVPPAYEPALAPLVNSGAHVDQTTFPYVHAFAGYHVANLNGTLAAYLAGISSTTPLFWLVNAGVNDLTDGTSQASFEADFAGILDKLHSKHASAVVLVAIPWRRGYNSQADTTAGWISNVLSTRSAWASVGLDERVTLKAGDDGATYTASDGIHPNAAGYIATAQAWAAAMGY
jgi:lysophospholipase L1-like esterase